MYFDLDSYANISLRFSQGLTLAGLCSGLLEGFVINPFEVVKIRLQADRHTFKDVSKVFKLVHK